MGLLDNLYFGQNANFGGQYGGLLDMLRTSQMQQQNYQPSAGFDQPTPGGQAGPIAVGDYQMPRMGDAAQFTPQQTDPAALPPNAQPTQGQLPMQPQMPQGEGSFATGMRALGNPGGLINNVADAVQGFSGAPTAANQTAQFLVSKGLDPALARTVVSDPQLLRSVLPQMLGMGGQTDDIKEYQFAKKEDPGLTFQKFMQQKKAVSGEYSLTPQYGTNEKGETVLIQTGKSGEAIQTKLPAGVKISSGVEKIDLGTEWGLIDKRTGQMVGKQAKDLRGAEREKEVGTAQGQAQAKIPAALVDAESTAKKIDELLANKGLDSIVGQFDQYRPSWTLGDDGRNALARLEQLQGGAFLQAFNTLKGGGAITEAEGRKAEQAIARMQRSQGEADFRIALQDFRDAVNDGIKKLRLSAGEGGNYPPSITNMQAPSGGNDLKKKYGLD